MLLVGFGHESGVGKDTCAKHLVTHLNCKAPDIKIKHINFADKLKDLCYQMYSWAGMKRKIHYENNRDDRHVVLPAVGKTPLEIWIAVGEAWRAYDPDCWMNFVRHNKHNADIVVCADVRHLNEAMCCDEVYKVHNPRVKPLEIKNIDSVLADFNGWHNEFINDRDFKKIDRLMEGLANHLIGKL